MEKTKLRPLATEDWPDSLESIRFDLKSPLNIHNIMAHHPDLMKAWMPFRNHVVEGSSLSPRQRELVILRTAHNCAAEYEWRHHVEWGMQAGLDELDLERVRQGPSSPGWPADESAMLSAVDDCHRHLCIGEKNLQELERYFSSQQHLDLMITVGMYMTLALIIKTYDVPMEDC